MFIKQLFSPFIAILGTKNIFEQQIQMAKFLQKECNTCSVAANDIGAIVYFTDITLLDMYGLGSYEVIKHKKNGTYTSKVKNELLKTNDVTLVIVYDSWFKGIKLENYTKIAEITGSLGKVMQESVATAKSFVRSISENILKIDDKLWETTDIHIHFPEGATPKDGPSAGGAIALVLSSIISDKKIKPFIAMTGEITLQGKILKIGGLGSKLTAAAASGIKKVFIPKDNISDLDDIPLEIKNKLEINFVSSATEIIKNSLEID